MDRQLAERMVGAACLLAVLVLVVPSILDGNRESGSTGPEPVMPEQPGLRTHTLSIDSGASVPPVPQPREMPGEAAGTLPDEEPVTADLPENAPVLPSAPAPEVAQPAVAEPPAAEKTAAAAEVPAEAPAVADAGQWYVQLGSFSSKPNAEGLARKLQASGFSATVRKSGNGKMLRVLVGPRADREAAAMLAGKLRAAGFNGQVTRLQP
jgi:cell division septation protein DedD